MRTPDVLDRMDLLWANDRSVPSCEALWKDYGVPGVSWAEAYMVATHRARYIGADCHDGRTVAFLEGLMVASALTRSQEAPDAR